MKNMTLALLISLSSVSAYALEAGDKSAKEGSLKSDSITANCQTNATAPNRGAVKSAGTSAVNAEKGTATEAK